MRSDAAFRLRDAVVQQKSARIVLLDLYCVEALEGGGLARIMHEGQHCPTVGGKWIVNSGVELGRAKGKAGLGALEVQLLDRRQERNKVPQPWVTGDISLEL